MFALSQRHSSPKRFIPPPVARDTLHRSAATRTNPAWHQLATSVRVSHPHDPAEREADHVADGVTRGEPAPSLGLSGDGATVHRMCAQCEEEQKQEVQAKREPGAPNIVAGDGGALARLEGRGQSMPEALRNDFEPRFGHDFSNVRLHTDSQAADSASSFNATAFSYGRHIVFGAGQFDPSSMRGRRLIAHELTHVVQQSSGRQPAVQRQTVGGPLDLKFDPCIFVPGAGKLCGQSAADACKKASWIPGCSLVCKAFDCSKPSEPKTICPPGWKASTAKGFEGKCCPGDISNEWECCTPDRIAPMQNRCCGHDEVVSGNDCKKMKDIPIEPLCPKSQQTWSGRCCEPPLVPQGLACAAPHKTTPTPTPTPTPPTPTSVVPEPFDVYFKLDRPHEGETVAALSSATTSDGKTNFDALVKRLKADPSLKVQLVGRASPEGTESYNMELGARRARMIAEALKAAGISGSRIADPPQADLRSSCKSIGTGLATCGEAGASGPADREAMARVFKGAAP